MGPEMYRYLNFPSKHDHIMAKLYFFFIFDYVNFMVLIYILLVNIPGHLHVTFEPPRGKTNNVVSEQVRHKPTCTSTEAG